MAAAQYFDQVQKIYIAFYQRPADSAGLKYWAGEVDKAGGDVTAVINAFAGEAESQALYGAIDATTIGGVIDKLYLAMFNRAPDEAGKQFYIDGFNAGTFTAGGIALLVLEGAQGADAAAIANKVTVANNFTAQVDGRPATDPAFGTAPFAVTYTGDTDANAARGILATVQADPATVLTPAQITAAIKADIADPTDPINGQGFALTTGVDTLTGTAAADTFTADILTLTAGDTLDGAGGNDTLNVETNASVDNTVKMTSIETINMSALGAVTVDFANIKGTTQFNSNNSVGAVTLANVGNADLALGLKGAVNNNISATYTAAAIAGTADVLAVNLNGATAASVAVNSGFESVKVNTTAESTLATLTTPGATAITLNNSAQLSVGDDVLKGYKTIIVEGAGNLKLGNVNGVQTFEASKATGAVTMGAETGAGLIQGTASKVLTMDTTGGLVQTGAGNDVIAIDASSVFSTNSTSVKLGAGNDSLSIKKVGGGGLYVFAEAGDDKIFVAESLQAGNLIDGGDGNDTINFANGTTNSLIARSIENIGLEGTGAANEVNFVSTDAATKIADGGSTATTVTGLLNGSTYTSSIAKTALTTLGFKAGEKATINANFTKGTTGGLTVTNAETVTATYGAASVLSGPITLDATAKSLTISATGALTGGQAIAASGTESLTTLVATGDKGITLGDVTNDAKLTSVSVKSAAGNAIVGNIGAAANNTADFQVSSIEVTTTDGSGQVGNIHFAGATTVTGLISSIVVTGAAAAAAGNIDGDKLGTVSVTSAKGTAAIGAVTMGTGTASDKTDGTITALMASGLGGAEIKNIKADKVDTITVQATSTTTAGAAKVGQITATTIGNVTVTSAAGDATIGSGVTPVAVAVGAESLGNVTLTAKGAADLGAITVTNTGKDSVTGNINVVAGGKAALGVIALEKAGAFNVKAGGGIEITGGGVGSGITFADTNLKTVALDAVGAISLSAGTGIITNTSGDLTVTVKAASLDLAGSGLTVSAGSGTNVSDIDIILDASQVTGAVGKTGSGVTVTNEGTDAASSTIVTGGKGTNIITINGAGAASLSTIKYQGGAGDDTIILGGNYASSTINTEGGTDKITAGSGADTINVSSGGNVTITDLGVGADVLKVAAGATSVVATVVTGATGFVATADTSNNAAANTIVELKAAAAGATINMSAATGTTGYTLTGGTGADTLTGSKFADVITGGSGDDTITGGKGADIMTGGAGANVYNIGSGDSASVTGTLATGSYKFATIPTAGMDTINLTAGGVAEKIALGGTFTAITAIAALDNATGITAATYATAALDAFVIKDGTKAYLVYETSVGTAGTLGATEIIELVGLTLASSKFAVSATGDVTFS